MGIPQGKKPAARQCPPCPPPAPALLLEPGAGKSRFCCSFSSEPPIRSLPGDISLERTSSPSSPVPNVKQTGRQCSWKPCQLLGRASAPEERWEWGWGVRARGTFIGAQCHSHGCSGGPAGGWSSPRTSFQGQRCFSFSFRMASSLALVAAAVLRGKPSSSRPLAMLPPGFPELFP